MLLIATKLWCNDNVVYEWTIFDLLIHGGLYKQFCRILIAQCYDWKLSPISKDESSRNVEALPRPQSVLVQSHPGLLFLEQVLPWLLWAFATLWAHESANSEILQGGQVGNTLLIGTWQQNNGGYNADTLQLISHKPAKVATTPLLWDY